MSQAKTSDGADADFSLKTPKDLADLALKPRIKVFLSADIVGSTAFKQTFKLDSASIASSVRDRRVWQETIERFYDRMKERFPVIWEETFSRFEANPKNQLSAELREIVAGQAPRFWKTVGDEVIFWKELGHEAQLWAVLHAWLTVIAEIRELLKTRGLDVKSTIWTAEFPVRNCALPARNNEIKTAKERLVAGIFDPLRLRSEDLDKADAVKIDDSQQLVGEYYHRPYRNAKEVDFIGPGIDVGFRIAAFSSNRRMAISVDVAYLLAVSRINHFGWGNSRSDKEIDQVVFRSAMVEKNTSGIEKFIKALKIPDHFSCRSKDGSCREIFNVDIHYSGTATLKGVLGSTSYPRFWISTIADKSYEFYKQKLYLNEDMKREGPEWDQLAHYCNSFYDEHSAYLRAPVIVREITSVTDSVNWSSTCTSERFATYWEAHMHGRQYVLEKSLV